MIILEAWPTNDHSDPDIYLKVGQDAHTVSDSNYTWKANNHGKVRIEIDPSKDKRYVQNQRYFVAVYPCRKGVNEFQVSLSLIHAKTLVQCRN